MKPAQLIKHYKTQVAAALAIGCNQSTVSNWCKQGRIPDSQQLRIQAVSGGALVADTRVAKKYGRLSTA